MNFRTIRWRIRIHRSPHQYIPSLGKAEHAKLYCVACIQNSNCAFLISPIALKYLSSHSSDVLARDWSAPLSPNRFTVYRHEKWSYTSST